MPLLGMITVLAVTGWLIWSIDRGFRRRSFPRAWTVMTAFLGIADVALGMWLLTREYLVSPTVRLAGYPFVIGGTELFEGQWMGGVSRLYLLAAAADIAAGIVMCLFPLRIAQFIFERRTSQKSLYHVA